MVTAVIEPPTVIEPREFPDAVVSLVLDDRDALVAYAASIGGWAQLGCMLGVLCRVVASGEGEVAS